MRIGNTDFPEPLLNALRDGRLVASAGAGVSRNSENLEVGLAKFEQLFQYCNDLLQTAQVHWAKYNIGIERHPCPSPTS